MQTMSLDVMSALGTMSLDPIFDLLSHRVSFKVHDILKTHRLIIIFCIFYGKTM